MVEEVLSGMLLEHLGILPYEQLYTFLYEALARYNRALEYGFDKFWVGYNRESLHAQLGNLKGAREDLKRAVAINPEHAWEKDHK